LAATPIDCAVVGNPCNGTEGDDQITGTVNADIINGQAGNDEISALDANDGLHGEAGNDNVSPAHVLCSTRGAIIGDVRCLMSQSGSARPAAAPPSLERSACDRQEQA
jgi:Ca2+-binding RTX toxin-like protein